MPDFCSGPQVLIIGPAPEQPEFAAAAAALHALVPVESVRTIADCTHAKTLASEAAWFPDLILVLESWPGQFPAAEVQQLLTWFPLARLICCFDVWCDSAGRSNPAWPLACHVPVSLAEARIRHELGVLCGGEFPLPLTAARDEIFEFDFQDPLPQAAAKVPIAVKSPDGAWRRLQEDLLQAAGYRVAAPCDSPEIAAVVWDIDPWRSETAGQISSFREELSRTAIIALTGFSRLHETQALLSCGATAVLPKLAPAVELIRTVEHCVARRSAP